MAAASLGSQRARDTVVNISNEGTENETQLAAVQETLQRMGFRDGKQSTMDPMLDRAPPPPYQEHNFFYPPSAPYHPILPSTQVLPSVIYPSLPSRSSPPPSYSQIDLTSPHFPSSIPHFPSQLGRPSSQSPHKPHPTSHLPSQLGGARPKKLQQANQVLTNKQMAASLRRAGLTNGQRIVNVRLKETEEEQEEMSSAGKGGVAIGIFTILFFFLYLALPYTPFSPWD